MLRIRRQQLEVFQPVAEAAFVRRVVEQLRENHADVVVQLPNQVILLKQIPAERLSAMVRNGISRAREYGMDWESTVTAFVVLLFVAAPNFDKHPLIQRVLGDERVPANSRIDQLWDRTSEDNWEAVKKNYNVEAWDTISEGDRQ